MEIKRYSTIYFLVRGEMKKILFDVDTNNPTDVINLLSTEWTNFDLSSVCKKIDTNKKEEIN